MEEISLDYMWEKSDYIKGKSLEAFLILLSFSLCFLTVKIFGKLVSIKENVEEKLKKCEAK